MRIVRPVMTGLFASLLVIAALGVATRLLMTRAAEDRVAPAEAVDIAALRAPLPPNGFLVCPRGYCAVSEAMPSPVFDMPWERLSDAWSAVIAGERRVVRVAASPPDHRFVYIQHSALFGFPDIITVVFVAIDGGRSSLAIYSRARYGRYDFGTNRKRVERWLAQLRQRAVPASR